MISQAIGKAVVKYGVLYVWRRYGRAIRVGACLLAVGLGAAFYLSSRNVPEG